MDTQEIITILPVQIKAHYSVLSHLMQGLQLSEKELHARSESWDRMQEGYMRHLIRMQEEQQGHCLLAMAGVQAVGFIFGYLDEEDPDSRIDVHEGPFLYVSDGFVLPEFRRKGIYRLLNRELEAHFIRLGVRKILRYTLAVNQRMQHFLQEEGYVPVRYLYEKWLDENGQPLPLPPNQPTKKT